MIRETWRDVVGYEGLYSISPRGRVRSEERIVQRRNGTTQRVRERMLKVCRTADDYRVVTLYRNGFKKVFYVHTLVSEAWPGCSIPRR
jgi:hypothetical protein